MNQKLIQKPCQSDPVVLGQPDANIVTIPAHKTDTIPKKKIGWQNRKRSYKPTRSKHHNNHTHNVQPQT